MGKLRERSGGPRWGATKKMADAYSKERAYKNRIKELEAENTRLREAERVQADAIRAGANDLANMRNRAETAEARIREMTGVGGLARGLYTVKEHEEIVQQKIREYAADFLITVCRRSRT